ncbi:choice-of-anchor X domain-containing protein [Alkalimonas mucilaginosa]|uniref:Dockerin type I domain-containing protein n=1 Tax=Alkalimonas mucilaginosa TaxID=3057676 RepID=A0ABU7JEC1_9GAMM|nr:choice-of-anchor X domain-containing protein [Alkalimonas sp. MEB004]MEE2023962.1 dockerin type I domain-containing protein [Alkalimonas sp. MEB004]
MIDSIYKKISWSCFFVGRVLLVVVAALASMVHATQTVRTENIVVGSESVEVIFHHEQSAQVMLEAIVPVDGASITLRDPAGQIIRSSAAGDVEFYPGADLEDPLPGGVFVIDELAFSQSGEWTVRFDYPMAQVPTVAMVTVYAQLPVNAGIVLVRQSYLVGEDASIGMLLVENGLPVLSQSPLIRVSKLGQGEPADEAVGLDDGSGYDGRADDGIYSRGYTFSEAGVYLIEGEVAIDHGERTMTLQARREVPVFEAPLDVLDVSVSLTHGANGCVAAVRYDVLVDVQEEGDYVARGTLQASNGFELSSGQRLISALGHTSLMLEYTADAIRTSLQEDGPYRLSRLQFLRLHDLSLAAPMQAWLGETPPISLDELCSKPIVIEDMVVHEVLQGDFIAQLEFVVPITVQVNANYQFSFKLVGAQGEDIALISLSRFLSAGRHEVSFIMDASQVQTIDGPYRVLSALVYGAGETAMKAFVGQSEPYLRWQFLPTLEGDLNGDGVVDELDRQIILNYRNSDALSPGDRRDITQDGKIDLRDARALSQLM